MYSLCDWVTGKEQTKSLAKMSLLLNDIQRVGLEHPKTSVNPIFPPMGLHLTKFYDGYSIVGDVAYNDKVARIDIFPYFICGNNQYMITISSREMKKEEAHGLMKTIKEMIILN